MMKSFYSYFWLLMMLTLPVRGLWAQVKFDKKKKSDTYVNTTSLNAKRIDASILPDNTTQVMPNLGSGLKSTHRNHSLSKRQMNIGNHRVVYSGETGLPIFISTSPSSSNETKSTNLSPEKDCYEYLHELKQLLRIDQPEDRFSISRISIDRFNQTHIRLNEVYKGIPVYGSEVLVHLDQYGKGTLFNGRYLNITGDINIQPALLEKDALARASQQLLGDRSQTMKGPAGSLVENLKKPEVSLVLYGQSRLSATPVLAWHIILFDKQHHRWEYFLDAQDGNILHRLENTCYADGPRTATAPDQNGITRTLNTYQAGNAYYMLDISRPMFSSSQSTLIDDPVGAIVTLDQDNTFGENEVFYYIGSSDNTWSSPNAVSAHYNAGEAYEYYRQNHNRNSIDGKGGTIISIINVPDQETGEPLDNAFWNGRFMSYGNGNIKFRPLAGSMDVAGHEMTHGVVENTAALIYEGESGAINESMADVFGTMMDQEDWLIGEDVVNISAYPSGALRSFSDPHNGGTSVGQRGYQPMHMDEKYTGEEDNGGVHINSGIVNHAFYLYAQAIGNEEAAEVYFKALSDYLTKSSQFIDLRMAIIQAASDIYGSGSDAVDQAVIAFNTVGIGDGQPTEVITTLPVNPGPEYILVYNTDPADPNTLYRTNADLSNVQPLTTTGFISRPSVTDDGEVAVFVADDNTLHAIFSSPANSPDEFIVRDEQIWSNAVVSKDGSRIAAVTTDVDALIYVYDIGTDTWASFALYNPTYTEGVTSSPPLYADALEFDYSGEYLVYDAFNSFQKDEGENIEYFDVNFIRVWDRQANDFGDGTVFKLFTNIPEKVSIGNPTFSKNSPQIVAFDYIDHELNEYAILGCNIETYEVNTLAENNTVSWPSFNKNDSRIAFTSLDDDENYLVEYINLNTDKISSDGVHHPMLSDAAWPVYFAAGIRDLYTGRREIMKARTDQKIISYPNPFNDYLTIRLPREISGNVSIEILNHLGQTVYSKMHEIPEEGSLILDLKELLPGYYVLRARNEKHISSGKIIKQ